MLAEVSTRVVIFIDEVDTTLSLPFSDDFFAVIRQLYNARAQVLALERLSFVLVGVASPSDLIRDAQRTPFNIGQRVDLTDFTFEEAMPLAEGLGQTSEEGAAILRWVLKWTEGHPYLTQRLCIEIAKQEPRQWTEAEVDRTVERLFFGEGGASDHNLQFVWDMLTKRAGDNVVAVLSVYRDVLQERRAGAGRGAGAGQSAPEVVGGGASR